MSSILLQSGLDSLLEELRPIIRLLIFVGLALAFAIAKKKSAAGKSRESADTDESDDEEVADPRIPPVAQSGAGRSPQSSQTALEDRVRTFMEELKRQSAPEAEAAPSPPPARPLQSAAPSARPPTLAPPQPPSIHTSVTTSLRVEAPSMAVTQSPTGRMAAETAARRAISRRSAARAIGSVERAPRAARDWRQAIVLREVLGPPKGLE